LLWSTIALCREKFNVGLLRCKTHRIPASLARCIFPKRRVFESFVKACIRKSSEWKIGKEPCFSFFPELVSFCGTTRVVYKMVCGDLRLGYLIEYKDDLAFLARK
jgi:hypothetical protein